MERTNNIFTTFTHGCAVVDISGSLIGFDTRRSSHLNSIRLNYASGRRRHHRPSKRSTFRLGGWSKQSLKRSRMKNPASRADGSVPERLDVIFSRAVFAMLARGRWVKSFNL